MFGLGAEVLEATCVTESLAACLLQHGREDLVLLKGHSLELYRVQDDGLANLYGCFRFPSRILAAGRIPRGDGQPDHLILAFPDSKFSVVRFSRKLGDFVTVSLHSYENELLLLEREPSYDPTSCSSIESPLRRLAVDPDGRCALLRLNTGNWAFHRYSSSIDDNVAASGKGVESKIFASKAIDERVRSVVDFVFLEGFYEPTLALIYEACPSWPAHSAVKKDTIQLAIVTISSKSGSTNDLSFTTIYHTPAGTGLPMEARKLLALPKSIGGVLLQGPNLFIHADHAGALCYCPLNAFAQTYSSTVKGTFPNEKLGLKSRRNCRMIQSDSAIWSSDGGAWYWLKFLKGSGSRGVTSMTIEPISEQSGAFQFTPINGEALFVATQSGDHSIYTLKSESNDKMEEENLYGDEEMDTLYISTTPSVSLSNFAGKLSFFKSCTLPSIGAISDFVLVEDRIMAIGGKHLVEIQESILLERLTGFELEGAKQVLVIQDQFLVVSTPNSSMILSTQQASMTEIEQTAFCLESPTILVTILGESLVQVTNMQIRFLTKDSTIMNGQIDLQISSACIFNSYIVCILQDGALAAVDADGTVNPIIILSPAKQVSEKDGILSVLHTDSSISLLNVSFELIFHSQFISYLPQVILNQANQGTADLSFELEAILALSPNLYLAITDSNLTVYRFEPEASRMVKIKGVKSVCLGKVLSICPWNYGYLIVGRDAVIFVTLSKTGFPRVHRLKTPKDVVSIAGYSESKFIVARSNGLISLESFNDELCLDLDLPFIRKFFDFSPHQITFNATLGLYGLVVSVPETYCFPEDEYCAIADNPEWKPPAGTENEQLFKPQIPRMTFYLMDSHGTMIDEYKLDQYERVTSLATVTLNTKETESGKKPFFVLGVPSIKGEDRPVRGRVLIFDVVQLVGSQESEGTKVQKLKLLAATEIKTPISAICGVNGYLAITGGVKTILYEFEDNESLTGVAFVDAGVYVTSSCAAKGNLICLGDAGMRGVGLFGFQEKPPKMVELAWSAPHDPAQPDPILHVDCLISADGQMLMVSVGLDGRLSFWSYAPLNAASIGGSRLVHRGVYRLDATIVRMHRFITVDGHVGLAYMTAEGSLGILRPLDERSFRQLVSLQTKLIESVPHPAGLHPRASRGSPTQRHWIDGDLMAAARASLPRLTLARLSPDASDAVPQVSSLSTIFNP